MKKRVALSIVLILGIYSLVFGQPTVSGTITDEITGETLLGAYVIIKGTSKGAMSNIDGKYELKNISGDKVTLVCSFISYEPMEIEVSLTGRQELTVDFKLSSAQVKLAEVEVVAKSNRESEKAIMLEQKSALAATQAIGAQELSRKGVSDAQGAVTKISGISKQEGVKNVFVRGLGDRYNTTTLNGFVLPSEDPQYKNISLDFFSNDMIQAVVVNKVFSSKMNSDVGGALIDIKSKELVGDSEFEIGISSSLNTETIGKNILLPDGLNYLGYSTASYGPYDNTKKYDFSTSLDPIKSNKPNLNLSFSGGRKFLNKHRFFIAGSIGDNYRYEDGFLREITSSGAADPYVNMAYTKTMRNTSNLLMGNVELNYSKFRVSYNSLYIHTGSAYHSDMFGKHSERFQIADEYGSVGYTRRQQLNDNTLIINQIVFRGDLTDRLKYNIGTSVNSILGKEPDRRIFRFPSLGGDNVQLARAENTNERFNNNINEFAIIPKINLQYKLSSDNENVSFIGIGYDARIGKKDFNAPIYGHTWNPTTPIPIFPDYNNIKLDNHFNQEALTNSNFLIEDFHDKYTVDRIMQGIYIDFAYQLSNSFILNTGLRLDHVLAKIDYEVNRGADIGTDKLQELNFSPSVNIKYTLNDKNHFRIGTSRTYTLPQDKEISPFVYNGFDGFENGNPDLEISTNYNFDIKWDYYISSSELISLNAFYKHILNPIARVDQNNSAGIKTYYNVGDYASAIGIEAELRKKILSFANKHHFNLGINASYIHTQHFGLEPAVFVQNINSAMEGATPYILNADLTYNMVSGKFSMNSALVLNYLGDKIHTIGTRGYNNLIEESITTIDFVNSIKINNHLNISFKAMNLLNPVFKLTREGATEIKIPSVVIRSFKKGIQLSLGLTYKF
jgi:hypothetical protein